MENENDILKAQIAALKDLLAIKDQLIAELKTKAPQTITYVYEYRYPQYQISQWPYNYQVYCGGAQGQAGSLQGQGVFQGGSSGSVNIGSGGATSGLATFAQNAAMPTEAAQCNNLVSITNGR